MNEAKLLTTLFIGGKPRLKVVRGEVAPQIRCGCCSFMHVKLVNRREALVARIAKGEIQLVLNTINRRIEVCIQ